MREPIACLGAGRMGRGIAVVFAFAGHDVTVIDFKPRAPDGFRPPRGGGQGRDRRHTGHAGAYRADAR